MNDTQNSNRPTHRIFHVVGEGQKKAWITIGAAWAHQDGEGLNLQLDYIPRDPQANIVIRTPKEREAAK